jgi:TatD DNase family protein
VVSLLLEKGAKKVQLHAFDGKASAALPAVEAGYYFSVPPSIVRSRQKQKLVRQLPLSCLLLETDSPVLGVDPARRNEPADILYSIEAIAEIKGVSQMKVAQSAYENTLRLYGERIL